MCEHINTRLDNQIFQTVIKNDNAGRQVRLKHVCDI